MKMDTNLKNRKNKMLPEEIRNVATINCCLTYWLFFH